MKIFRGECPSTNAKIVLPELYYCRVLGGLLSAHMLIIDKEQPFGDLTPDFYDNELLYLAHDLASRLMPAFEGTGTGIPYPRVSLP